MIIKLTVTYCAFEYKDKNGNNHYKLYVKDRDQDLCFNSEIEVKPNTVCDFVLKPIVDFRKDGSDRYRPGSLHGHVEVVFSRVSPGQ